MFVKLVTLGVPILTCLLVAAVFFYLVRVIDQMKGARISLAARVAVFFIGLVVAVGFPLYSHLQALEIGDYFTRYWIVPLIFFGAVISLNALRGAGLKKKAFTWGWWFGWGWWCLGIALTLEYLLLLYGSRSTYDLLQPPFLAKILILVLGIFAFICFPVATTRILFPDAALESKTTGGPNSDGASSKVARSREILGLLTAIFGLLTVVLNLVDFYITKVVLK